MTRTDAIGGTDCGKSKRHSSRINTLDVSDSTVIRKWKWLFVNGCECEYCSGIFKLMPRWDRYIDVFEAVLNAVITHNLFL
jgi:hypothetical protein